MTKRIGRGLVLLGFGAAAMMAQAADVALVGVFPGKAVLVVDGGVPKAVAVGQMHAGVKVLSVDAEGAVLDTGGRKVRLTVGQQPISLGASQARADESVTLAADSRGHFVTTGTINGAAVTFLVDTGASSIAMGPTAARQAGVNYLQGERGLAGTANGVVPTWRVRLNTVTLGPITLKDVDATIVEVDMPVVLLGMSFLNRMEMNRSGSTMTLKRRY